MEGSSGVGPGLRKPSRRGPAAAGVALARMEWVPLEDTIDDDDDDAGGWRCVRIENSMLQAQACTLEPTSPSCILSSDAGSDG